MGQKEREREEETGRHRYVVEEGEVDVVQSMEEYDDGVVGNAVS